MFNTTGMSHLEKKKPTYISLCLKLYCVEV